ncbi:MAG: hypothetical protein ACI8ZN_002320 [Bacteroidia bacterium]|jgi:hypothetical protein
MLQLISTKTREFKMSWCVLIVFLSTLNACEQNDSEIRVQHVKNKVIIADQNVSARCWVFDSSLDQLTYCQGRFLVSYKVPTNSLDTIYRAPFELGSFVKNSSNMYYVTESYSGNIYKLKSGNEIVPIVQNADHYNINQWNAPIQLSNNKLYFTQAPKGVSRDAMHLQKMEYMLTLDGSNDMRPFCPYQFSVYTSDYQLIGLEFSKVILGDLCYISLPIDHRIYIFKSGQLFDSILKPSKALAKYKFPIFSSESKDYQSAKLDYVTTTGRYGKMVYLKHINSLARLAIHPQGLKNQDGFTNSSTNNLTLQIISLDANTTRDVPLNANYKRDLIPYKNGILIQKNLDKDHSAFDYFDISIM